MVASNFLGPSEGILPLLTLLLILGHLAFLTSRWTAQTENSLQTKKGSPRTVLLYKRKSYLHFPR